ncbi:MAG: molybdopterin-binding protein, partial [Candidatus Bathyarchaeia archaeon]
AANGATPIKHGIIPDTYEELRSAIESALESDMIVLSGGSSVGARDLLYNIVNELGRALFHGVQVKPGKPTLFGIIQGKPLLGMPGYPTSCLSNAYLLLAPAVREMARLPQREPRRARARMGHRFVSSSGRTQFLTVKIREGKAYQAFKESGAITSMSEADGYILVPLNVDVIEEGEEVVVTLLE